MNIFNKVVLQSLKKNRTRTLVTIIGVILSTAMITAVATFTVSLQDYMVKGAEMKYGNWHVGFGEMNPSFIEEQVADDRVGKVATYENIGYATLEGGKNPDKPYLFIAGFNAQTFNTLPVHLVSGRLPENSGEILVPAHIATNGGVQISLGETLSLTIGNRMNQNKILNQYDPYLSEEIPGTVPETLVTTGEKNYKVVGIYQRPTFETYTAPGYTLITMTEATHSTNCLSGFVTLQNPWQIHSYVSENTKNHSYVLNDEVLRFMGLSNDTIFNGLLYSVGGLLMALIMIGSVFLIYNAFTISLSERMHQFGILLSVGATEKQLRNSVLFEGFCIGMVGIPIGILIGIPSIQFILSLVSKNFGNILYDTVPLTLVISIPSIIVAVGVSMLTILISAYIPARKATSTPVMACIRQTNEIKVEAKAIKTSKLIEHIYGLEGMLALKNFKRNKRRYRSIVLSLTLSIVLFVSASAFGTNLNQIAQQTVVNSDYDICFCTQDMEEDEVFKLYERMKNVEGIYGSSYQGICTYSTTAKEDDFSQRYGQSMGGELPDEKLPFLVDIQFVEESVYLNFIESLGLSKEEYMGQTDKMIAVAKAKVQKESSRKEEKDELVDMFEKSSMAFTMVPQGESVTNGQQVKHVNLTFVDTIPVDTLPKPPSEVVPYTFMVIMPYTLKAQFVGTDMPMNMGLTFLSKNPSKSVEEMEKIIEGIGVTSEYNLYNLYELFEQNRNMLFIVDLFTVVFVIMISLIAIANVFNTISTNIRLRRRELAMLRSVGMGDHDFNKMMCFECALYGARTLLWGLPMAGFFVWLIYKGMVIGGATIDFTFPWSSMAISVLGVFFAILTTTLYALGKVKKENIIDGLRDEMV